MSEDTIEVATLGGGCFWCIEAIYLEVPGVIKVIPGYAGGKTENPTYQEVCSGETGHAEVIQITFDSSRCSYENILRIFFSTHNPTTLNRQGNDIGDQYRSVIFYHSEKQKQTAEGIIQELEKEEVWSDPIVTQLEPLPTFYLAEDYHHNYFKNNPDQPYCNIIINPKLTKFKEKYLAKLQQKEE